MWSAQACLRNNLAVASHRIPLKDQNDIISTQD